MPIFGLTEIEKHRVQLCQRVQLDAREFVSLLETLLHKIEIIPSEKFKIYTEEALAAVEAIDIEDAQFIACALAYSGSFLWSDDKALKQQTRVRVLNTAEIKEFL